MFSTIAVTITLVPISTFGLHSLTSIRVRSAGYTWRMEVLLLSYPSRDPVSRAEACAAGDTTR